MAKKTPKIFPREQRTLDAFGERLRLARKRRKISTATAAVRAGISRMTLHRAERGAPEVAMGTYFRILTVLSLSDDFNKLAADDELGRRLQDLELK